VTAKDTATGKDQKITITASSGLNESEIQKMVKEAAEHESDDKARREQVERRNKLDNLCYTLSKSLPENREEDSAKGTGVLRGLIDEGRKAIELQDDAQITRIAESLETEARRLASAAAEQGGSASSPDARPAGSSGHDRKDVVDAEFEERPSAHS
jgi:molecular chaperone DnaK